MSFHVRRKDKEIVDEGILRKILKMTSYVTIAMSMDNQPYLASLSHAHDEKKNCLYFHCAKEGKKLQYLKANNRVWGQALLDRGYAQGGCTYYYASVQFSGKVTFVDDIDEKQHAIEVMTKQMDKDPEALLKKLDVEQLKKTVIGRIDIEGMSGKKSKEVTI